MIMEAKKSHSAVCKMDTSKASGVVPGENEDQESGAPIPESGRKPHPSFRQAEYILPSSAFLFQAPKGLSYTYSALVREIAFPQ